MPVKCWFIGSMSMYNDLNELNYETRKQRFVHKQLSYMVGRSTISFRCLCMYWQYKPYYSKIKLFITPNLHTSYSSTVNKYRSCLLKQHESCYHSFCHHLALSSLHYEAASQPLLFET
jgi:hypothetical protein